MIKEEKDMENLVKVHLLGAAAVVVSTVKQEDWELAEKYAPEALKIMDENGEPVFKVMTGSGTGSINRYGVVWGNYPDEEGRATITILLDEDVENRKEAVMEVAGSALMELTDLESRMPEILAGIREKQQQMENHIVLQ